MTDGSISELCGDLKKPYSCADTTCAQDIDWDLLANDTFKADTEDFVSHYMLKEMQLFQKY